MTVTESLGQYTLHIVGGATLVALLKILGNHDAVVLRKIPTIGPSFPGLSYLGAARLLLNSSNVIQEGYDKYKQGLFKVADFQSWVIFASHPRYLEDIRKAPTEVLGFDAAIDQALHALAPEVRRSHLHIPIVQNQLTRELHTSFGNIDEEITLTLNEAFQRIGQDWSPISGLDVALEVVARTTHRIFVGLPLCREPEYVKFTREFATQISKAAGFIRFFPHPIRRLVGRRFVDVPLAITRMSNFLRPLFYERKRNIAQFGQDDAGNPEDMLSWFMEVVDGNTDEEQLKHAAFHMLMLDFGAVYTTSTSFTQAVHHLAAHPELQEPLRKEIESVVAKEGWSKNALSEMKKLDSFFKESQRLTGLAAVSTYRQVLKPFTFSDGVEVPAGTTIAVTAHCTHMDPSIYPNADEFDAFRFAADEGENSLFVTPSPNYLPFGMGRHTCPGRFFTITLMKTMMAHLILDFEVKLRESHADLSSRSWFGLDILPSGAEDIVIRRRQRVL